MVRATGIRAASLCDVGNLDFEVFLAGNLLAEVIDAAHVVVAHKRDVVSVVGEVLAEVLVLLDHAIVRKGADEDKGDKSTQDGKTTTNPEGASVSPGRVGTTKGSDDGRES